LTGRTVGPDRVVASRAGRLACTLALLTLAFTLLTVAGSAHAGPVSDEREVAWVSMRDLTSAEFSAAFHRYRQAYRPSDVDAYPVGGRLRYSMVWERDTDGRQWAELRNLTSDEYHRAWERYRDQGLRPHDIEGYLTPSGPRFAGIWLENRDNLAWSSRRNLTGQQYAEFFKTQRAAGRRPVDLEFYDTRAGRRIAAIFYANPTGAPWAALRDMTRARYQREVDRRSADGLRVVDFESYRTASGQRYAAVWDRDPAGRAWTVRSDRTARAFANLWRQYRDEGYRLVEFEAYPTSEGQRYAGVWVENNARFRYPGKRDLDELITAYRSDNDLPGISVAVIHDGSILYQRGFGWADVKNRKTAHGGTVYNAASVSKAIGGTLAAKLEDERQLDDGSAVDLDLTRRTDTYLSDAPDQHTHQVDHLLAHLGCIAHYATTPAIADQSVHYDTAIDAVESIWNTGLVTGCTVGQTRSYSTAGFTFLGAVLERVTDRRVSRLISDELATPYGLPSMRMQWADDTLPSNYERAVPYGRNNQPTTYEDSSWKALGGGIEVNSIDLARFGWKVLNGEIIDAATRDARLWSPVRAGCGASTNRACQNGLAWRLRASPERVAEHDGSWPGARSFLRVYRDSRLVVAVMSNRRNHTVDDVATLTTNIANTVRAPGR
jgi:CubicO group peptidase (beta-lactamase class C family)